MWPPPHRVHTAAALCGRGGGDLDVIAIRRRDQRAYPPTSASVSRAARTTASVVMSNFA
jgi:hypothetical protein